MATIGEKIEKAQALKEKGNEFFKAQNFKKALVQYNTGIAYTKGLPGRDDGLEGLSSLALMSVAGTLNTTMNPIIVSFYNFKCINYNRGRPYNTRRQAYSQRAGSNP